jgi:hypothetical protein
VLAYECLQERLVDILALGELVFRSKRLDRCTMFVVGCDREGISFEGGGVVPEVVQALPNTTRRLDGIKSPRTQFEFYTQGRDEHGDLSCFDRYIEGEESIVFGHDGTYFAVGHANFTRRR